MDGTQILTLGLGLEAPWILKNQYLDTAVSPTAWTSMSRRSEAVSIPAQNVVTPAKLMILPTKPGGI